MLSASFYPCRNLLNSTKNKEGITGWIISCHQSSAPKINSSWLFKKNENKKTHLVCMPARTAPIPRVPIFCFGKMGQCTQRILTKLQFLNVLWQGCQKILISRVNFCLKQKQQTAKHKWPASYQLALTTAGACVKEKSLLRQWKDVGLFALISVPHVLIHCS